MRSIGFIVSPVLVFLVFFCGIYRHDVPKQQFLDLARQRQFDCVERILYNHKAKASCVLIDRRYVLSAAHVFVKKRQRFVAVSDFQFEYNGKQYNAAEIIVHPAYSDSSGDAEFDIALVRLMEDVTDISAAMLNARFDELHTTGVIVGYGQSKPSRPVDTPAESGEKLAGENVIDSVWGPLLNGRATKLSCDFDSPTEPRRNKMGSAVPLPMEYMLTAAIVAAACSG